MKEYFNVYWSFNHNARLEDCSCVRVVAYDLQDAKGVASRQINNPLAWVISAKEA